MSLSFLFIFRFMHFHWSYIITNSLTFMVKKAQPSFGEKFHFLPILAAAAQFNVASRPRRFKVDAADTFWRFGRSSSLLSLSSSPSAALGCNITYLKERCKLVRFPNPVATGSDFQAVGEPDSAIWRKAEFGTPHFFKFHTGRSDHPLLSGHNVCILPHLEILKLVKLNFQFVPLGRFSVCFVVLFSLY